jgi:putative tryptophan/tyrosine transport system substrate-binding protein
VDRRAFVAGLGAALAVPPAAVAQQSGRLWRIGFLTPVSPSAIWLEAFRAGLRDHGYADHNIVMEVRNAENRLERLPKLAQELVRLPVDTLLCYATPATRAAKTVTTTTPIVMIAVGDPVAVGLIDNLARPGANITGLTLNNVEIAAKKLQLLKDAVPQLSRVALLGNEANPAFVNVQARAFESAAVRLGVQTLTFKIRDSADFESAFDAIRAAQAQALVPIPDPMFAPQARALADAAMRNRLASILDARLYVEAGALLSYGPDLPALYRGAATFVDKILKGARPAELPVEQPTKFELVINLKTARALGLTIPPSLLGRADEVLE